MSSKVTVAAIQMEILPLNNPDNININLDKAAKLLQKAVEYSENKIDLVVFPEDCITGPGPFNVDHPLTEDSEAIVYFKNLARRYDLYIVAGTAMRKIGSKIYNRSLLIDNKGEVVLRYDKNNLWLTERKRMEPGTEISVASTPFGNVGLTICWDLVAPRLYQELARQEVDIICCPSYWLVEDAGELIDQYAGTAAEANMVDALCPARAIECEALFIFANGAGIERAEQDGKEVIYHQLGHSQIAAPVFGTLAKIDSAQEGYIVYTYDRSISSNAEANYLIRKDIHSLSSAKQSK